VTVNGQSVPACLPALLGCAGGWTYYPDLNSVYFGDDVLPDKGDRIDIHYTAMCL
jgi:hypothetical protein